MAVQRAPFLSPGTRINPSPELAAVFEAMLTFMGADYSAANASVSKDGQATTSSMTATDANFSQNQFTYTQRIYGNRVQVTPAGATALAGATVQFAATVVGPDGVTVPGAAIVWSLHPGAIGTIDQSGLYTAPATIPVTTVDTVRATAGESWTTVTVSMQPT